MCRIYRRKHGLKRHQRNTNGHNSGPRRSVFRVRDGSQCRAFCATRTWCPAVCPSRRLVQTCPRNVESLSRQLSRFVGLCSGSPPYTPKLHSGIVKLWLPIPQRLRSGTRAARQCVHHLHRVVRKIENVIILWERHIISWRAEMSCKLVAEMSNQREPMIRLASCP